ncbi:uncharacterized protein B0P05DRAFT_633036 [Gilbertella persicaria]|uniref:uncharacterized protein n=1 Tax=Gilbertella persicaria TaxID=101096 RepID=UPI00221E90A7|nr:uncharacterized protein B0P05DRAFT_633036 [Gilbertella persicaria]KAI8047014.1 hypothetical protein B0P05DRAFT_633036 [Gilbertella persicaria]
MNQTTIYKITQMQQQISQLEQKIESQTQILKGLMHLLAPSFAQSDSNEINCEVLEAAQQAREGGIANSLNPNLMGFRDIPRVLEEATKAFGSHGKHRYVTPRLRLLALINLFKKERNMTDLLIDDKVNENDYGILRTIAKNTHDEMELELLKTLKKNDKAAVLPLWSEVPSALIAKYTFKLESNAATHGFHLQRFQHSWAAGLLLFETHKHRSNKQEIRLLLLKERITLGSGITNAKHAFNEILKCLR